MAVKVIQVAAVIATVEMKRQRVIAVIDTMIRMVADKVKPIELLKRIQITPASTMSDKATASNHLQEPSNNSSSNWLNLALVVL